MAFKGSNEGSGSTHTPAAAGLASSSLRSDKGKSDKDNDGGNKGKETVSASASAPSKLNKGAVKGCTLWGRSLPPILVRGLSGELPTPQTGEHNTSWDQFAEQKVFTPDAEESESLRYMEMATSGPRKRFPGDIKSFSHELTSKGVKPFPFWKPRSMYNLKEVLKVIQQKFEKAKEEVNSDLATFAGELVGVMEKSYETHPEWKETLEDLLILARSCCVMTPSEFWLQCEGIAQDLQDRRQELPMGALKKLYARMLFILTRCTRFLQFRKESGFAEDEIMTDRDHESKIVRSFDL